MRISAEKPRGADPKEDPLRTSLTKMIIDRYNATPRHMQKALGPSEIGHPCMRKLAFGLMQEPACNPQYDPLPSIIGTATHTWLESAARHANEILGRERWVPESRVHVDSALSGSSDLLDRDSNTVIDWKVPGTNRFAMYKKEMSILYIRQGHMYGLGFENAGYQVDTIAIALLPRGGTLRGMHLWKEPYDRDVAEAALANRDKVIGLCDDLDVTENPDRYAWIPNHPYDCRFCDWYRARPSGPLECNGKVES